MNPFDHQWQRLTALARQAPVPSDLTAPVGFATRVVARMTALPPPSPWAGFEQFALRGLAVAAVLGVCAVALNYYPPANENADDVAASDAVSEYLDLS